MMRIENEQTPKKEVRNPSVPKQYMSLHQGVSISNSAPRAPEELSESRPIQSLGPDGGIDIRNYQDDSGKATSIVQCKAWGARYVGVPSIRELLGVMTQEKIEKAFFMTSGRFSDDAKVVAKSNRITLIDGQMLLMRLQRLPSAGQNELLTFATEGEYTTPTCPGWGKKMRSVPGKAG